MCKLLPSLRLGTLVISTPLVLAPMAGVTDLPFRRICRRFGAGITITEMIASRAIDQGRERTLRMAEIGEDEHPVGIQIAGSDPAYMREAALWAQDRGADFIDINMGCPVKKVCKQHAGSALLKNEPLVAKILETVVSAVAVPVTLKIRTGWDEQHKNVEKIATIAEECGVAMLTVHGRTRAQGFRGKANWEDIGKAKQAVNIPVIGNGDVVSASSAIALLEQSGCDGIMIGRAAQGNPWIFKEILCALHGKEVPEEPDPEERWAVVREHLMGLASLHGVEIAKRLAHKHVAWYSKGLPGGAEFRARFHRSQDWDEQLALAEAFFCRRLGVGVA